MRISSPSCRHHPDLKQAHMPTSFLPQGRTFSRRSNAMETLSDETTHQRRYEDHVQGPRRHRNHAAAATSHNSTFVDVFYPRQCVSAFLSTTRLSQEVQRFPILWLLPSTQTMPPFSPHGMLTAGSFVNVRDRQVFQQRMRILRADG